MSYHKELAEGFHGHAAHFFKKSGVLRASGDDEEAERYHKKALSYLETAEKYDQAAAAAFEEETA